LGISSYGQNDIGISKDVNVSNYGDFKFGGLWCYLIHFGPNWQGRDQREGEDAVALGAGYPKTSDGTTVIQGKYNIKAGNEAFEFTETIIRESENIISFSASLGNEKGIESIGTQLRIELPADQFVGKTLMFNDAQLILPEKEGTEHLLYHLEGINKIVLPVKDKKMILEGAGLDIDVEDLRPAKLESFLLIIKFKPYSGLINKTALSLTITLVPYANPIDIRKAANMDFRDDIEGDRKGGWTDQGEKDLRLFNMGGRQLFGNIPFEIIEPCGNDSRSCIVLGGAAPREYFPSRATVPMNGESFKYLSLLHASAWTPEKGVVVGRININYSDGDADKINIISGIDVNDWCRPVELDNGSIAWDSNMGQKTTGLFLSKFPVKHKGIAKIDFISPSGVVWMIVGATGMTEDIPDSVRNYHTKSDDNWHPFVHSYDVESGSILDFSYLLDPPAGKYGMVKVRNGHFEFDKRPGKRIKFYGNHVGLEGITKDECGKLAERFAKMGYNSARIHVYDQDLQSKTKPSFKLDRNQLDILDYLFYCFKQKGIYLTIDLYVARVVFNGEIPEVGHDIHHEYKFLVHLLDSAYENWKEYARNLLLHVNPYTGLQWKDDPALYGIGLINEDTPYHQMDMFPEVKKLYYEKYKKWMLGRCDIIPDEKMLFHTFITEQYLDSTRKMMSYLREIGVGQILTDVNFMNHQYLSLLREKLDYVDNHWYYDLPLSIEAKNPYAPLRVHNRMNEQDYADLPRTAMPTRMIGKPFTLSEWNQSWPNPFRASSGSILAAYASLQDWDGVNRFKFCINPYSMHKGVNVTNGYLAEDLAISNDPINLLSERAGILLFMRDEVIPAQTTIPWRVTSKCLLSEDKWSPYPVEYSRLGLLCKIGTIVYDSPDALKNEYPAIITQDALAGAKTGKSNLIEFSPSLLDVLSDKGCIGKSLADIKNGTYASETGQIVLNAKDGFFKLATDRSEAFSLLGKISLKGNLSSVENLNGDFCHVYIGACDTKPLKTSERILILHLTDVTSTGMKFRDSRKNIMEAQGKLPFLVRSGQVKITVDGGLHEHAKLYPLDMAGRRSDAINVDKLDGNFIFTLSTLKGEKTYLAYELLRE
jgi:hypothetical protein